MMNFKFFKGNETSTLFLTPHRFQPENVEFCFQFGDNNPIVFASGPNECHITLNPTQNGSMIFTDNNNNSFKLFAREISNV